MPVLLTSRLHLATARPAGPIRELLPPVPRTDRYTRVPQQARIRPGLPIPGRPLPAEILTPVLPPVHQPTGLQQSLQVTAVRVLIVQALFGQARRVTAVRVTVTPAPAGRVHRATAVRAVPAPAGQALRATAAPAGRVHRAIAAPAGQAAVPHTPEALPAVRGAIPDLLHTAVLPIQVREEEGKPVRES